MKRYSVPLSLAGAALALAGGLAYLLGPESAALALANLGAGLALVVIAGLLNPELFRQYGRWLNAFWGSLMVLGIAAMLNFLGTRYHDRLDLTAGKLHSLADLTLETLKGLPEEVHALGFMEQGKDEALEGLLKEYASHGSQFSYEFVDPDRDPDRTKEYGVRNYNTLVLESGKKQQKVTELNEKEITSALLKLVRDRQDKVYLSVGHGEGGAGAGEQGYGRLKARLQEFNYEVEDSLFLARAGAVPADCALLVVLSPKTPFLSNEVEALRRYLKGGGAALVLLDPPYQTGLEGLLGEWGIEVENDFVIDTSGLGSLFGLDYTSPVAVEYGDHPVTRKHRGLMTFYELCRSVHYSERSGLNGTDLVKTSKEGWAETDLGVLQAKGNKTVKLDEGVDRPGPISLAAAVDAGQGGGRLVVFGDADFAGNRFFDLQGNGDLALNAISWLAEDESLISIRPREPGYNPIALTESQSDFIFWLTVVLYPLAVAVAGIAVVSRKGRWNLAELSAAGLGIVLSLGVVGLLNFIGDRYHARFDLSADKLFTLSEDTHRLLDETEAQNRYISVKTFMAKTEGVRFQEVMDQYRYASKHFDYEVLDPQKHTLEVKQYGVRERGTSVVEVSGEGKVRTEKITAQSEEALSNAIQRAMKAEERKVYFTGGHQEGQLSQVDGKGFSILGGRLKEMNFQVEEGLGIAGSGIPEDATLLAVVGPRQPLSPAEAQALRAYLKKGHSALFMLDPGPPTGLEGLLDEYGVELGQNFVVDLSGIGQLLGADVSVPVVVQYGEHPITARLSQGTMSFYPLARSVSLAGRPGPDKTALVFTHRSSWGESDLGPITGVGGGQVEFDPARDKQGPLSLGVAVKAAADSSAHTEDQTRLVVFGDADFASNQYFGQQANGELLASSISWLGEGEDKLDIPLKEPPFNPINLIGNQGAVVLWVSVFIVPFAVALSGVLMMLRRGYQTYASGFISWLMYTFIGAAIFYFIQGVIGLSEASAPRGQGYLLLALLCGAASYGLFRRQGQAWILAAGLAVLNAAAGLVAIPHETIQLLFAALWVANACILVWIKKAFGGEREG
ncbi:MAG: GldG family protein [Candidatus Latescibacteria bacterium]|nr:GldG family protein [Candidatus Latescibacterota bacterium]